jgi:hypothetical protein
MSTKDELTKRLAEIESDLAQAHKTIETEKRARWTGLLGRVKRDAKDLSLARDTVEFAPDAIRELRRQLAEHDAAQASVVREQERAAAVALLAETMRLLDEFPAAFGAMYRAYMRINTQTATLLNQPDVMPRWQMTELTDRLYMLRGVPLTVEIFGDDALRDVSPAMSQQLAEHIRG